VALSGRDRTRYARHLLLTQLGEAGQERLLAAQVVANGDADAGALAVARRYLTRAGVQVCDDGASSPLRVATAEQVATMAGHPSLRAAARALAGALSAVNTIQSLIGVGGVTLSGSPVQPQIFFAISSEEA
jgi:hypothetical protein